MNNIKISVEDNVLNYISKIQCLNKNCKYNLEGQYCNLKNILINENGSCFNFDSNIIDNKDIEERLDRK